jgi:hypothetical protein
VCVVCIFLVALKLREEKKARVLIDNPLTYRMVKLRAEQNICFREKFTLFYAI